MISVFAVCIWLWYLCDVFVCGEVCMLCVCTLWFLIDGGFE